MNNDIFQSSLLAELALILPDLEEWSDLRERIGKRIKFMIDFDYATVAVIDPDHKTYRIVAMIDPEGELTPDDITAVPIDDGLIGEVMHERTPAVYNGSLLRMVAEAVEDFGEKSGDQDTGLALIDPHMEGDGIESIICCPLRTKNVTLGALTLGSKTPSFYTRQHTRLAVQIAQMVGSGVELLLLQDRYRGLDEPS